MTIGGAIALIAIGAILKFAVTAEVSGINLAVVGDILMIAGAIGLVVGLILAATRRTRRTRVERYRTPSGDVVEEQHSAL